MPTAFRHFMTQIPKEELIEGRWYVGRGRNANVALWCRIGDRFTFLTIGFTFKQPVIKDEGYFNMLQEDGCFQPFMLIDEGEVTNPWGDKPGWDKHYARCIIFKEFHN